MKVAELLTDIAQKANLNWQFKPVNFTGDDSDRTINGIMIGKFINNVMLDVIEGQPSFVYKAFRYSIRSSK
jgi:hypothetical protein